MFTLRAEQWVPKPVEQVFEFFSDAYNLSTLTPPWVNLRIVHAPPLLGAGVGIGFPVDGVAIPLKVEDAVRVGGAADRVVGGEGAGAVRGWTHQDSVKEKDGGTLTTDWVKY